MPTMTSQTQQQNNTLVKAPTYMPICYEPLAVMHSLHTHRLLANKYLPVPVPGTIQL